MSNLLATENEVYRHSNLESLSNKIREPLQELSKKLKATITDCFKRHFTEEIIKKYGLTLVCIGSLQREEVIPGLSDVDLKLFFEDERLGPDGDPENLSEVLSLSSIT